MADISSSDVSVSVDMRTGGVILDKSKQYAANISFGDGALTYPSGGIPLLPSMFGFRQEIASLAFSDASSGDGLIYKFDKSNAKIRIYRSASQAAHSHNLLLKDAVVADGATSRVNADVNKLGANTGSDITVDGGGANGGVQSGGAVSAAALVELSGGSSVVAATTLKVMVIGR